MGISDPGESTEHSNQEFILHDRLHNVLALILDGFVHALRFFPSLQVSAKAGLTAKPGTAIGAKFSVVGGLLTGATGIGAGRGTICVKEEYVDKK